MAHMWQWDVTDHSGKYPQNIVTVHPSGNLAGIPITGWQGTLSHSESQTPYQIYAVWWGWSDGVSWEVLTAKLVIVVMGSYMLIHTCTIYMSVQEVWNGI